MPTKKATSAAPAASRTHAPQPSQAAERRTETRESHDPSESIVPEPAKPFQGLVGLNQRTDVAFYDPIQAITRTHLRTAFETSLHPRFDQKHPEIQHLMILLASIPEFCDDEQGVFLSDLQYCRGAVATGQRVRRLAARLLRAGYFVGYLAALSPQQPAGGAL